MSIVNKGRGYVYSLQYHIVWCVKYRKRIIEGNVEVKLKELIAKIAFDNGFSIISLECTEDHVHILIDCTPQHYIPDVVKALKGNSARFLFKDFPQLKKKLWGGHLWNPSYFVSTVSENTLEQVKKYIDGQKEGEPDGEGVSISDLSE